MGFSVTLVFVQKVLTVLPPLELFSLEEKAAQLPGGLFVCVSLLSAENFDRMKLISSWNEVLHRLTPHAVHCGGAEPNP